jgi:hypothetical protein
MVRVPIESQEQIEELIDLTFEIDLPYQRAEICQTWARRLEGTKQIGLALLYFEKGQSFTDIRRICWSLFERLLLSGTPIVRGFLMYRGKYRVSRREYARINSTTASVTHDRDIDCPPRSPLQLLRPREKG